MLVEVVRLDAVVDDGGTLDLVAAETNKGDQEDTHTSTKKCRKRGSKGLAVSCLAIDNEECVSVECKVVRCNELEIPWDWHSQHSGRCLAKDGQPLWRNELDG